MAPSIPVHAYPAFLMSRALGRRDEDTMYSEKDPAKFGSWRNVNSKQAFIVEGWGQGFMFGALMIMAIVTVVNMKKKVLLHKLILLEVSLLFLSCYHRCCFWFSLASH